VLNFIANKINALHSATIYRRDVTLTMACSIFLRRNLVSGLGCPAPINVKKTFFTLFILATFLRFSFFYFAQRFFILKTCIKNLIKSSEKHFGTTEKK